MPITDVTIPKTAHEHTQALIVARGDFEKKSSLHIPCSRSFLDHLHATARSQGVTVRDFVLGRLLMATGLPKKQPPALLDARATRRRR